MMRPQGPTHRKERWVFPVCQQHSSPLHSAGWFRSRPGYWRQPRQILPSNRQFKYLSPCRHDLRPHSANHKTRLQRGDVVENLAQPTRFMESNVYLEKHGSDLLSLVRLASKDFVGNPAPDLSALVDVDVFTPPTFRSGDPAQAKIWLNEAHVFEKSQFFRLFSDDWLD